MDIIGIIRQDTFKAYAQQLIAAQIVECTSPSERRIHDSLMDLFVNSIYSAQLANDKTGARRTSLVAEFRRAFEILWVARKVPARTLRNG